MDSLKLTISRPLMHLQVGFSARHVAILEALGTPETESAGTTGRLPLYTGALAGC